MFRYSPATARCVVKNFAFLPSLSSHFQQNASHFHTQSSLSYATQKVNPKKEELKKKVLIATLLQRKRQAAKKLKSKGGKRSGKATGGGPRTVSPNLGKIAGKKGAKVPVGMPSVSKDAVYDASPRMRHGWTVRKVTAPSNPQRTIAESQDLSLHLIPFLSSKRNVLRQDIKFDAKGVPQLVPLFDLAGLNDVSSYVNNFYSDLTKTMQKTLESCEPLLAESNNASIQKQKDALAALDQLIGSVHEFESVLHTAAKYVTTPRTQAEYSKYQAEFHESIPQSFSQFGEKLVQVSEILATSRLVTGAQAEKNAHQQIAYWLKRYGAHLGPKGYSGYASALKNLTKHLKDMEKKVDNATFISIPTAYSHQLPVHLRANVEKYKTKFLGMDSYKLGAATHVIPALRNIRDPFVRRDVFAQAREAIDGGKSKYLPLMTQATQLMNKLAQSLGFENAVDMQTESRYGLTAKQVRANLLDVAKNAYNDTYVNDLIKSKQKENAVWKYTDKQKDALPDYDKLHTEHTHYNEILGIFGELQNKSYLPLHLALRHLFDYVEKNFNVQIKTAHSKPGELWNDEHVKKFTILKKGTQQVLSQVYLDIFPRDGKDENNVEHRVDMVLSQQQDSPRRIVVHSLVESPMSGVPSSLTHVQLSTLFRLMGEAFYLGIFSADMPYTVLSNSKLAQKTMGSFFARMAHDRDVLSKFAGNLITGILASDMCVEDMLLQDPVVRPIQIMEQAALSILDLDLFSDPKASLGEVQKALEESLGKGKLQPDFTWGQSIDKNGARFVDVYGDILGAELYKIAFRPQFVKEISFYLRDIDKTNAIKSELKEAAQSESRQQILSSRVNQMKSQSGVKQKKEDLDQAFAQV